MSTWLATFSRSRVKQKFLLKLLSWLFFPDLTSLVIHARVQLLPDKAREESKKTPRRPRVIQVIATGVIKKREIQRVDGCSALHIVKSANPQISPTVLRALVDDVLVYVFGVGISIVIHVRLWMLSLRQWLVASWLRIEERLERETAICWDGLVLKDWIIDAQYLRCHLCEGWFPFRYLLTLSCTLASGYTDICFRIVARQYVSNTSYISRFYEDQPVSKLLRCRLKIRRGQNSPHERAVSSMFRRRNSRPLSWTILFEFPIFELIPILMFANNFSVISCPRSTLASTYLA